MKRNIVILLCLVFFTQSAFAMFGNDCRRERKTCNRELAECERKYDVCYNYNTGWQELHKDESARIEKLETQRGTCIQEKDSWETKAKRFLIGIGVLVFVFAVGGIAGGFYVKKQWGELKNQNEQIVKKDAKIAENDAHLQNIQHGLNNMLHIIHNEE